MEFTRSFSAVDNEIELRSYFEVARSHRFATFFSLIDENESIGPIRGS